MRVAVASIIKNKCLINLNAIKVDPSNN